MAIPRGLGGAIRPSIICEFAAQQDSHENPLDERERFIELMTSDRKLKASREGSKRRMYGTNLDEQRCRGFLELRLDAFAVGARFDDFD